MILSPVFKGDLSNWRHTVLLGTHECIRRALRTLVLITDEQCYQHSDIKILKLRIETCFEWYNKYFVFGLPEHHTAEEDIIFPWIEKTCKVKLPKKISKDHDQLIQMMDDIKNSQNEFKEMLKWSATEFAVKLKILNQRCCKLEQLMSEHLNEEERSIVPLITKYNISYEQFQKMHKKIETKYLSNLHHSFWMLEPKLKGKKARIKSSTI